MSHYIKKHLPLVILTIILNAIAYSLLTSQAIFQQILLDLAFDGEMGQFVEVLIYGLAFVAVAAVVFYLAEITREKFQKNFKKSIRDDVFTGIMKKSKKPDFSSNVPYYSSVLYADVSTIGTLYSTTIGSIWGPFVSSVVALVIMLISNPLIAAVVVGVNLFAIFLPKIYKRTIEDRRYQESDEQGEFEEEVTAMLEEAANEKKDPLALRNEFDKRFASINESYAKAEYRHSKVISWVWGFPQVLTVFRNLVVSFVVVLMILNDNATIGTLALFISLNHSFFHGVSVLVTTLPGYKDNIDAFTDEVRDIIDGRDLH